MQQRILEMKTNKNKTVIFYYEDNWWEIDQMNKRGWMLTNTFSKYSKDYELLYFGIFLEIEQDNK